jgi:hypothetical protein
VLNLLVCDSNKWICEWTCAPVDNPPNDDKIFVETYVGVCAIFNTSCFIIVHYLVFISLLLCNLL